MSKDMAPLPFRRFPRLWEVSYACRRLRWGDTAPRPRHNPPVTHGEHFEAGDIARLKTGGPPMVVRAVSGDTAYCQWYAGVELHQGTFLFSSLRNVSSERRTPAAAASVAAASASVTPPRSSASS